MEEGKASVTAKVIAMFRAAHLLWDDRPKIFEDTLALQLSGCENEAALRVQLDGIESEIAQNTDPHLALTLRRCTVLVRSRYLEDEVEQAVARGVSL
jgi:O-methyltransferase involved in polyketide biosynthesis